MTERIINDLFQLPDFSIERAENGYYLFKSGKHKFIADSWNPMSENFYQALIFLSARVQAEDLIKSGQTND